MRYIFVPLALALASACGDDADNGDIPFVVSCDRVDCVDPDGAENYRERYCRDGACMMSGVIRCCWDHGDISTTVTFRAVGRGCWDIDRVDTSDESCGGRDD